MNKIAPFTLIALISGCATIINGGSKPVTISSPVPAAKFTITDSGGTVVHSGVTPQRVVLSSGDGYFSKAQYNVKMSKNGYEDTTGQLDPSLNGWYWGNIMIGGLLGMLVVDPITGAMYKLPDQFSVPMRKLETNELASATTDAAQTDAPEKSEVYGKWQFQAEKLAQASSCGQPALVNSGPGVELYTLSCNQNPSTIRCDFGQCAVQ